MWPFKRLSIAEKTKLNALKAIERIKIQEKLNIERAINTTTKSFLKSIRGCSDFGVTNREMYFSNHIEHEFRWMPLDIIIPRVIQNLKDCGFKVSDNMISRYGNYIEVTW